MFVAVTEAPGTRLLLASTTVPEIVPRASCAAAASGMTARRTMAIKRATVACVVCMDHLFLNRACLCGITVAPSAARLPRAGWRGARVSDSETQVA